MDLWNCEKPVADFGIDVPDWIEQDIAVNDVAAIEQGGCASGAYMPAVIYHRAARTMAEHGDDVLDYLHDVFGELPRPSDDESWSGTAVHYLSCAVEAWALGAYSQLEEMDDPEETDE